MGDELTTKIDALATQARAKRRAAFETLTALDPEQAAWLTAMNEAFGRFEAIEIKTDGVLYRRGKFGR